MALDGFSADIASDGDAGLEMFRSNDYDLVLLDLKMPGPSPEMKSLVKLESKILL